MPRLDTAPPVPAVPTNEIYARDFSRPSDLAYLRAGCTDALEDTGARRDQIDIVILLLSELMTNALCHAPAPYHLMVERDLRGTIVIEVSDGGRRDARLDPRLPAFEKGGYGLALIETLADVWGVHRAPGSHEKVVWAAVARDRTL